MMMYPDESLGNFQKRMTGSRWIKNDDGTIQSPDSWFKQNYHKTYANPYRDSKITKVTKLKRSVVDRKVTVSYKKGKQFYESISWKRLRKEFYESIPEEDKKCECCGWNYGRKKNKNVSNKDRLTYLCVDHKLPVRKFWEKRLDKSNLQVLCNNCNESKGNELLSVHK